MNNIFRHLVFMIFLIFATDLSSASQTIRLGISPLKPFNYFDRSVVAHGLTPDVVQEFICDHDTLDISFIPTWIWILGVFIVCLGLILLTNNRILKRKFDRRTAELQSLTARQKALLVSNPYIVMEVDETKTYVWANPAGYDFYGSDVIGKEAMFYFEGEQNVYSKVSPLFNGTNHHNNIYIESWQRRSDGEKRLLAWWCRELTDQNGNITGAISTARDITDEKQTQEALRNSEEKFRSLYDNAPLSYQSLDEDGRFLDVNPTWLSTLGYEREEVIGTPYADLLHPDWKPHFEKNFPEFKRRGSVHDVHFRIRHKKGHYLDISFEGCIGYLPDGSFKQTYCVFQDVTQRKLAEEALRASEERYRMAQAVSHVGNWEYDLQTTRFLASDEAKSIYGFDLEDPNFSTDEVEKCIPEKERVHQALVDLIEENKPYNLEFEIHPRNGSDPKTIVSIAELKQDEHGAPQKVVGIIQDVTERKQIEKKIEQQQYYLEKAQELGRIGTWKLDLIHNTLDWTDESCRIFGVPCGSVVNYEIFLGKIHPDDLEYVDRGWKAAIDGKPYDIEHRIVVDGITKWVREKAEMTLDNNGVVISAIGFTQDITERKQAEATMIEQLEELKRWQSTLMGREGRVIEIKKEVNDLLSQLNQPPRYRSAIETEPEE